MADITLFETRTAILSNDRLYRTLLRIVWDKDRPQIAFVGLNPSTADEFSDDPTIRRMKGFAQLWGYGGIQVFNLFSLRATDPQAMIAHSDPIPFGGHANIGSCVALEKPAAVVCCWGTNGAHMGRGKTVAAQLSRYYSGSRLLCFGLNGDGSPKHPLYLKGDLLPVPFEVRS